MPGLVNYFGSYYHTPGVKPVEETCHVLRRVPFYERKTKVETLEWALGYLLFL